MQSDTLTKRTLNAQEGDDDDVYRPVQKRRRKTTKLRPKTREEESIATSPAQQAVLNTAELVENIIFQLPPLRILVSKRVCQQWKATTEKSGAIREKLDENFFFRSSNMPPQKWRLSSLVSTMPSITNTLSNTSYMTVSDVTTGKQISARLHPLLQIRKNEIACGPSGSMPDARVTFTFRKPLNFGSESLRDPAPGSWRKMFVADPPWYEALVIVSIKGDGPNPPYVKFGVHHHVVNPNGITMGDLIDAMLYQKGNVTWYYSGNEAFHRQHTTLGKAVEKFEARWGRQMFQAPLFNCLIYWSNS